MQSSIKYLSVWGVLAALAATVYGQTAAKLTDITYRKVGEGVELKVHGSGLTKPRAFRVGTSPNFMVEFDANLIGKNRYWSVRHGGLKYFTVGWFDNKPPKVRVRLVTESQQTPVVEESENGWLIRMGQADVQGPYAMVEDEGKAKLAQKPAAKPAPKVDNFPDKVPPLEPAFLRAANNQAMAYVPPAESGKQKPISLMFENTDVVQILKALAMQADTNIVTAPDVKGQLTVSLERVTVVEALDIVTSLIGARYARVGRAYVVASAGKFAEIMRQLNGEMDDRTENKVIPIYSGEGMQIKAAVLKSVSSDSAAGQFEILLPSDQLSMASKNAQANEIKADEKDTGAKASQGVGTVVEAKTDSNVKSQKDPYLVVIGTKMQIANVERYVRALDNQICQAMGLEFPTNTSIVRETYTVRGGSASDLLLSIGVKDNRVGNVDVVSTPKSSTSRQSIVLNGRDHEVQRLLKILGELDATEEAETEYLMYDVKFADPRSLREAVIAQVPGLRASIPPASAANPRLYVPGSMKKDATDQVVSDPNSGKPANDNNNGQGDQGSKSQNQTGASVAGDKGNVEGLAQPFKEFEGVAYPMRLIIRGTRDQLKKATEYLSVIDVEPKQFAVDMRVVEMTKEDAQKFGLDWNVFTGGTVKFLRFNQGLGAGATEGGIDAKLRGVGGYGSDILGTIDSKLTARKVLARPNLLAIDGREAELFIGDTIRYIESIQSSQNGTSVTVGEVPVGVRFALLGRVGGDGMITMDLRPVVSALKSFTPVPGGGSLPQTSLRIAQNTVQMKSGETIALGGLILDADRRITGGIPFLKDLPIVGRLFSRTDTLRERTEIVFFITVKEVKASDRANAANPADKPGNPKP